MLERPFFLRVTNLFPYGRPFRAFGLTRTRG